MAKKDSENAFQSVLQKFSAQRTLPRYDIKPAELNQVWNGFHLGTVYAMWSEAGGGKSTLAMQCARSLLKQGLNGVYIDVEKALNEEQQTAFKLKEYVDNGSLAVLTCSNFKDLEEIILALPGSGIKFVVIDSITMVRPYTPNEIRIEDVRPGIQSAQTSAVLNKLKDISYAEQIGVILVSHARANIQISGYGNRYAPDTKMAGGFSLQHIPDVITEIGMHAKVKDDDGNIIGVEISIQTSKNKWTAPFQPVRAKLIYGRGIDPRISIIETSIELGIITKEGRSLIVPGEDRKYNRKTIYDLPNETLRVLQEKIKEVQNNG